MCVFAYVSMILEKGVGAYTSDSQRWGPLGGGVGGEVGKRFSSFKINLSVISFVTENI